MILRQAKQKDKSAVLRILKDFKLGQGFKPEETLVADIEGEVVGCARLKTLDYYYELCSVRVKEEYQGEGIGTRLVKTCIAKAKSPVYCLTFAPRFFEQFGFRVMDRESLPKELIAKAGRCNGSGREWVGMVRE